MWNFENFFEKIWNICSWNHLLLVITFIWQKSFLMWGKRSPSKTFKVWWPMEVQITVLLVNNWRPYRRKFFVMNRIGMTWWKYIFHFFGYSSFTKFLFFLNASWENIPPNGSPGSQVSVMIPDLEKSGYTGDIWRDPLLKIVSCLK